MLASSVFFEVFSNRRLKATRLTIAENVVLLIFYNISKWFEKMSLNFEKCKNHQNHSFFEVAVLGINKFFKLIFCRISIFNYKTIKLLSFTIRYLLLFKVKENFLNLTVSRMGQKIKVDHAIFSGKIFCVKRPQLFTKIITKTSSSCP